MGWLGAHLCVLGPATASRTPPLSHECLPPRLRAEYNLFFYAQAGQRLAFTCVRTADLPRLTADLREAEGLPPASPSRSLSWYWTAGDGALQPNETNIEMVIARAKALGSRLLFFISPTSNDGDFLADPHRFPSGFARTADRVRAAGLEVGIHLISPGAYIQGTAVAREHPELFVPQGASTRDYFDQTDSGAPRPTPNTSPSLEKLVLHTSDPGPSP